MLNQLSNLQQRLIMGSIFSACLLVAIYLSHTPYLSSIFVLLTAALISLALREYYHIAQLKGFQPLAKIGIFSTLAYVCSIYLMTQMPQAYLLPPSILGITLAASFLYYFVKGIDPFINLAVTIFGIAYVTLPLAFIIFINYFHSDSFVSDGRWCVIYLLAVTKMTDTGAFCVGKYFGKTQLSTYISPKKTWEGAFGGLFIAILTSLVIYGLMQLFFSQPPVNITVWQSIWLAMILSVTAQFGDLAESLLKRNVGVKDSSHLPGLGGILDIADSLIFTAPLMYLFLKLQ